jgi:hypothetical protein
LGLNLILILAPGEPPTGSGDGALDRLPRAPLRDDRPVVAPASRADSSDAPDAPDAAQVWDGARTYAPAGGQPANEWNSPSGLGSVGVKGEKAYGLVVSKPAFSAAALSANGSSALTASTMFFRPSVRS